MVTSVGERHSKGVKAAGFSPRDADVKTLDAISVATAAGEKRLELCHGDLTNMRTSVDLLIISAGPMDYIPTPGSVVGALHRKGVVIAQLAMTTELDLREGFSCWLSREVDSPDPGIRFRRILCVEPRSYDSVSELVSSFFRALVAVLASAPYGRTAAMPVVFSGGAGLPVSRMTEALVDGTIHWMALGLPLECLKIVVYDEADARQAARAFLLRKPRYRETPFRPRTEVTHDVFLSYAHENMREADDIISILRRISAGIRIFKDREIVRVGGVFQHELFMALDSCKKVVALLSPDYIVSDFCVDEFNIAMLRGRSEGEAVLYPVYLFSAALPTYFRSRLWSDCREGDRAKLESTCGMLVKDLEAGA
jgi:TIR domain